MLKQDDQRLALTCSMSEMDSAWQNWHWHAFEAVEVNPQADVGSKNTPALNMYLTSQVHYCPAACCVGMLAIGRQVESESKRLGR